MKFIERFCKALNTEAPKNEKTSELVCGLAMCWAMALLVCGAMWLVYGG